MAPCPAGENDVALAPGYAANVEVATATPKPVDLPEALDAPGAVRHAGREDDRGRARSSRASRRAR